MFVFLKAISNNIAGMAQKKSHDTRQNALDFHFAERNESCS
jgi:hypothetical protein